MVLDLSPSRITRFSRQYKPYSLLAGYLSDASVPNVGRPSNAGGAGGHACWTPPTSIMDCATRDTCLMPSFNKVVHTEGILQHFQAFSEVVVGRLSRPGVPEPEAPPCLHNRDSQQPEGQTPWRGLAIARGAS